MNIQNVYRVPDMYVYLPIQVVYKSGKADSGQKKIQAKNTCVRRVAI